LKTRHEAAVRATFEPDWDILTSQGNGNTNTTTIDEISSDDLDLHTEDIQNAKYLISLLSLLPESAIIPKNRLIVYSGMENKDEFNLLEFPAELAFNLLDELNLLDILEDGKSVRMHSLLREFVYEKITQDEDEVNNQPSKLKSKSITNLKNRYYDDFSYLVDEYSNQRVGNIDSILEDFQIILEWSKKNGSKLNKDENKNKDVDDTIINSIYSLYKILEQESHNLRLKEKNSFISSVTDKIDRKVVFAQQIHIRATDLGQNEIIQRSRDYMQTKNRSFLNILWARVKDKTALLRTLEGHSDSVNSVAVTSDGTKIVSGSEDKTIKVWDLTASGRLLNTLEGHHDSVSSVAVTPDGTKIVSGSNKTIKVWDLNNGSNTFSSKFDSAISSIAISNNRNILAIGDSTGGVYVLNM
jgi:WD40 repeat protein